MDRWTQERLQEHIRARLGRMTLVPVSSTEPYLHLEDEGQVRCVRLASGVVTALDPVMRACGGTWVAHGSGSADRKVADSEGKVLVPPESPRYTLKRVWLTEEEERGHYHGFANEALWPLCHIAYVRPTFREHDWAHYCRVNHLFAEAVREEITGPACVWIQDYQFALLPRFLKERRPELNVGHFWHIPWPTPEVFRICPWKIELVEGLLANDLLGFQIRYHCDNFLDTVGRELEAQVDRERSAVTYQGHTTLVRPFPISVDFEELSRAAFSAPVEKEMDRFRARYALSGKLVALGLDRIDSTKGIPERFQAVNRFLENSPEYRGRFVLCQAGLAAPPQVPAPPGLKEELTLLAAKINRRHGAQGWQPIVLIQESLDPVQVQALYRLADLCLVSSLHDGMNLVAKEYVAVRCDGDGVLLLSQFTGAARELTEALLLNPFDIEAFALRIREACTMPAEERAQRMARMRERLAEQNIYRWAAEMLETLLDLPNGRRA
jgi:trehalose 6-phosphate synthase